MEDLIAWLRGRVPGFLRPAVNWLLDLPRSVFGRVVSFLVKIGGPWTRIYNGASAVKLGLQRFASSVLNTLWHLRHVAVPALINLAVDSVVRWASHAIGVLDAWARARIAEVVRWAGARVDATLSILDGLRRWAVEQVARVWATLTTVARLVGALLTSPVRLAEWLAAAMLAALLRYVHGQRDRLVSWLLRSSGAATLWLARELERVLVRLL